jgi:penicillin-binding protein 1C
MPRHILSRSRIVLEQLCDGAGSQFLRPRHLRHARVYVAAAIAAAFFLWIAWPRGPVFHWGYSRLVYDCRGTLLRATLAPDNQLRFPPVIDSLPAKYVTAAVTWEDRRFFLHPGIDPFSLVKVALTNSFSGDRRRGASTITMQLARLSHPRPRTYFSKAIECADALRYTLWLSKRTILSLYASQVPMGGNVVGIEAASWRYFGKPSRDITWAEAALFAVLPNAPSMINIERQRPALKQRRDRLLQILFRRAAIDSMTYVLSSDEQLPAASSNMPFLAPHFSTLALRRSPETRVRTSLALSLQDQVCAVLNPYVRRFREQGIMNCAVLVVETPTGQVRAYVGSQDFLDSAHGGQVDGIMAKRSTGSLLKPYLTALALERGPFTARSRLADVPTFFGSFAPQNASKEFSGIVTVEDMLIQSLNVPAVRLLHYYGLNDFYSKLKHAGFGGLFRSAEGYGLSLIIGGAEASLWELTALYAALGNMGLMRPLSLGGTDSAHADTVRICSDGASWITLNILRKLSRPDAEYYWHLFTEQVAVAWKTGTSYGQKDAWAIGTNRQWTIGVWVGNFDGEGNAMLGGAQSAGPILFGLFNTLSDKSRPLWFDMPEFDLRSQQVCTVSGFTPGPACPSTETVLQPGSAYKTQLCPFHKRFLVSRTKGYEVCSRCWSIADTAWVTRVVYPPSVISVLSSRGMPLDTVPIHNPSCPALHAANTIEILYPVNNARIELPRNVKGEYEKLLCKAGYQRPAGQLFWYLNGRFIAETNEQHNLALDLDAGAYKLVIQDSEGASAGVSFRIYKRGGG